MYEYLPAIGTLAGGWLFIKRRARYMAGGWYSDSRSSDLPTISYLMFWFLSALTIYILAGEKMPWLTVHLTLPMIFIASWSFSLWFRRVDWVRIGAHKGLVVSIILLVAGLALFDLVKVAVPLVSGWSAAGYGIPFQGTTLLQLEDTMAFLSALVLLILMIIAIVFFIKQIGLQQVWHITNALVMTLICMLTLRTSIVANYIKFDDLVDPQYSQVKNNIDYARNTNNTGPLFTYMNSCNEPNVLWGSNEPVKETCLPNHIQMEGRSCNNIWNNSTKRKTIVNVDYKYPK